MAPKNSRIRDRPADGRCDRGQVLGVRMAGGGGRRRLDADRRWSSVLRAVQPGRGDAAAPASGAAKGSSSTAPAAGRSRIATVLAERVHVAGVGEVCRACAERRLRTQRCLECAREVRESDCACFFHEAWWCTECVRSNVVECASCRRTATLNDSIYASWRHRMPVTPASFGKHGAIYCPACAPSRAHRARSSPPSARCAATRTIRTRASVAARATTARTTASTDGPPGSGASAERRQRLGQRAQHAGADRRGQVDDREVDAELVAAGATRRRRARSRARRGRTRRGSTW